MTLNLQSAKTRLFAKPETTSCSLSRAFSLFQLPVEITLESAAQSEFLRSFKTGNREVVQKHLFFQYIMKDLLTEKHIYKVSELTRDIRMILEDSFPTVWVEGEISNLRTPQSGHIYFSLKDDKAQLKCVFFKRSNINLDFKLEDGLFCVIFGRISVYERDGQYQLYVENVHPKGKGALQLAFEQLKKKLAAEGLFDKAHKRPLPFLPQKIGIVTSATGAALRDILKVIDRRYANVHIIIRPALVQGKAAAADIAQGIKDLNAYKEIDVLIVGRGGGSLEDLWPFNEEIVARAVYHSKIPVISAVGHEIDYTICDFVADLRAPTPSVAAELVVQEKDRLSLQLNHIEQRLTKTIRQKLKLSQMHLLRLAQSYALRRPQVIVEQYQQRIDSLDRVLRTNFVHLVAMKQERLKQTISRLVNLNPLAILSRGFSVTYLDLEQRVLKNTRGLKKGDILKTKLHKGVIISRIEETKQ